jgi:ankyrin repeat protein
VNAIQEIHRAARKGDLDQVQALLSEDPHLVHARDDESPWPTPLHQAATGGHVEVVEWLLAHGADARWSGPQTPLHVAWQRADNTPVIRVLVAHGAAHSEIFAAVYLDDPERVVGLLHADPRRVDERDDAGMTPLHRAAENGQLEMVGVLLAHGADVEAPAPGGQVPGGQTPLQRAYFHHDILELLLAHGASMDIFTAINVDRADHVARLLDQDPGLVGARMGDRTPLQVAARRDNPALVRLLLDRGSDVHANGGWKGWTPLHWAAHDGRAETARLLLAWGADPHAPDLDGSTPSAIAAARGHQEIVDLLVPRGERG